MKVLSLRGTSLGPNVPAVPVRLLNANGRLCAVMLVALGGGDAEADSRIDLISKLARECVIAFNVPTLTIGDYVIFDGNRNCFAFPFAKGPDPPPTRWT